MSIWQITSGSCCKLHLLMLGQVIGGRYQIIERLGGGGFGQTYLAEDQHLPGKPRCVVKQLKPKLGDDPVILQSAQRLFDQEAEMLYQLGNHSQIPKLFAHFEEQHEFYLVQEWVEGEVLSRELKRRGVLTETQVIELLQDLLTTLEFVHQQQVIHRDIKPSNLIRRKQDQTIVLIDFGAVKQISFQAVEQAYQGEDSVPTSVTLPIGSSGYMPNEQMAGKPRFSSDIYAVGMVGIRALTGLRPAQLTEDARTGEICWRSPNTQVSDQLAAILDTMVRYDFRQRYPSATEALAALNALANPGATVLAASMTSNSVLVSDWYLVWLERGDELFQRQQYQGALTCYDKAIQAVSNDCVVWFKRGMALENLQRHEEALAAYSRVTEITPNDYLAWFKWGKTLEQLQRYDEALVAYERVIQIQPDNYWAWHDRGKALEMVQRYEEAVVAYNRAVQLKPDFQLAVESRKRVLSQLQQVDQLYHLQHYEEAIASCEQAIRAKPDDALAWLMRGMALENSGQHKAAIASYKRVVQLQPNDHLAWFKLGVLREKLKCYQEALNAYNQVVRIQPENCWAWHDRGKVLEALRRYEDAIVAYDKAIQLKPDFQAAVEGRQRVFKRWQQELSTHSQSHSVQMLPS